MPTSWAQVRNELKGVSRVCIELKALSGVAGDGKSDLPAVTHTREGSRLAAWPPGQPAQRGQGKAKGGNPRRAGPDRLAFGGGAGGQAGAGCKVVRPRRARAQKGRAAWRARHGRHDVTKTDGG